MTKANTQEAQSVAQGAQGDFMLGNANAAVGALHKSAMAKRLSDPKDALAQAVARMAGVADLAECCSFKSGESSDMAQSGAEVGMLAIGADGSEVEIDVMVKTCSGFGSSNQTSRFWAADLLSQSELQTPAAGALRAICGSLSSDEKSGPKSIPGHLVGHDYAKTGLPLQKWLATPSALDRIARRAFGVEDATPRGKKLLLITMRAAMPGGDDLHVLVDRARLRDHVRTTAASKTKDGSEFVSIGCSDEAIELCGFLRLKRKGGDSGARQSDQLQTSISPRELLRVVAQGSVGGCAMREEPSEGSLEVEALASAGRKPKSAADEHGTWEKLAAKAARAFEWAH
jgi:hypothetical protein